MSKKIIFVTGNERKIGEARLACEPLGLEIIQKELDIDEIQSHEPKDVSLHKARAAYEKIKEPLVVTDTFWRIPALSGFPGAYMKDVASWFSEQDFIDLMADKQDRTISFSENITYIDGDATKMFSKEFSGTVVKEPRGIGNSVENIAEFEGYTLGEHRERGSFSHDPEDYVWIDFAKWYLSLK